MSRRSCAEALIAAEDRRFYSHGGVDPIGIGRALWTNLRSARTEGGSTLTQQLVKNEYLTSERTLWRKAREAVLSVKLERIGGQGRDPRAVPQHRVLRPGRVRHRGGRSDLLRHRRPRTSTSPRPPCSSGSSAPPRRPTRPRTRRRPPLDAPIVLAGPRRGEEASPPTRRPPRQATPIAATPRTRPVTLTRRGGAALRGVGAPADDRRGGRGRPLRPGLRSSPRSTSTAQAAAEAAVAETLTDPAGPQAALVALDTDGAIRAHVGGRDFDALAGRPRPRRRRRRLRAPTRLHVQAVRARGRARARHHPRRPLPGARRRSRSTSRALRSRCPTTAARGSATSPWPRPPPTPSTPSTPSSWPRSGPTAVADAASGRWASTPSSTRCPRIALGVEEVSPLDLASAYLTLADDGTEGRALRHRPHRRQRRQRALGARPPEPEEGAIDQGISRAVTHALRGVIDGGTGRAADIGRPAAGKTGTTQDNVDAWFAGYVPGYTAVVWMGFPRAGADGRCAGPQRHRRVVPSPDLGQVHGRGHGGPRRRGLPGAAGRAARSGGASEPRGAHLGPGGGRTGRDHRGERHRVRGLRGVLVGGDRRCAQVASEPEVGSSEDARATSLTLPDDIAPGSHRVVAHCDRGHATAAEATLVVSGTATSTTSSTTTTESDATTTVDHQPPRRADDDHHHASASRTQRPRAPDSGP